LLSFFASEAGPVAGAAIRRYFEDHYTGSQFERLADRDANRITTNDIVAVSMLGVDVPPAVSIWLLGSEGQDAVCWHLTQVPTNVDIWEDPSLVAPDADLWKLWDLLGTACWPSPKAGNGMGPTTISKLLAAKRPRLVPVTDSVIVNVLLSAGHWADFADALSDVDVRSTIESATSSAPEHLSLLRRIDIALWMLNH
jgi:hypothetical protein